MNEKGPSDDRPFLPSASLEMLWLRGDLLSAVRGFFDSRGYWEVETPLLSHDVIVDAHLEPFAVVGSAGEGHPGGQATPKTVLFLQTSPEFGMKRLVAAGAESIYQITRALRRDEHGRYHNPEFTMVEWYRVGETHHEQMAFTEDLVKTVFHRVADLRANEEGLPFSARNVPPEGGADRTRGDHPRGGAPPRLNDEPASAPPPCSWKLGQPFDRLTYDEAFEKYTGSRALALSPKQLAALARRHGLVPPPGLRPDDRDGWLNLLLVELVEPQLGREQPVFVYDYPASQASLARIRRESTSKADAIMVAERFELYLDGLEICNGYHELTDPAEYRERIRRQSEIRAREGRRPLPEESRLLEAMEAGLPACAGVALGFDRLVMLATGARSLHDVMAFPFDRA